MHQRVLRPRRSRDIAKGEYVNQRAPQFIQKFAHPGTVDVDISNATFTILSHITDVLRIDEDVRTIFKPEFDLLNELRGSREDLCKRILGVELAVGKKVLNSVASGAAPLFRNSQGMMSHRIF